MRRGDGTGGRGGVSGYRPAGRTTEEPGVVGTERRARRWRAETNGCGTAVKKKKKRERHVLDKEDVKGFSVFRQDQMVTFMYRSGGFLVVQ